MMTDIVDKLEKRLRRAVARKQAMTWLAGTVAAVTIAAGLVMVLSLLAVVFVIPVPLKLAFLAAGGLLFIYFLYRLVYIPARRVGGIIPAAVQLEKNHSELKGRLVAALQFRDLDTGRTNFSSALIELTINQAQELTAGIDFNEIVSAAPVYKRLRPAAITLVLAVLLGLVIPGLFSTAFEVYSQPMTRVAPPPGYALSIFPESVERIKYSDIEVGGRLTGVGFPEQVELFYRFAEGRWQSEKIRIPRRERLAIAADSSDFRLTLRQVRRSFDYYVIAGEVRSATFTVTVVDRPRVTKLKITIAYPPYTKLPPLTLDENTGSFAALVGSHADLEIEANREIDRAALIFGDSTRLPLACDDIRGRVGLTIGTDFTYHVELRDRRGDINPDPIEYTVTAVADEYPRIDVLFPGFDLNLDENMLIPFRLHVADDYGFTSLVLKYQVVSGGRKGDENVIVISYPKTIAAEGEVGFNWDLENFNLLPSDYILYHFELADNDNISGPKVTLTRTFAARLPSIDEIVQQSETEQQGRVTESERILQEQRDMAQRLEQLAQQMKTGKNLDWQSRKELENLLNQQQQTGQRLEEMAREMKNSVEKAQKNNLLSEQILQKLSELQKLFEEIATPEMKDALRKLQEALKEMSEDEMKQAMAQFQMTQEEMLKRLERTVELMKRLQVQQKMTAMLKMAEETLLEQNRVNVETQESSRPEAFDRQQQREAQLEKQMGGLKDEAGKLTELLEKSPFKGSPQHELFVKAVTDNRAGEDMNRMEASLAERQKEAALTQGRAASGKLDGLVNTMRGILSELAGEEGQKMVAAIREAINDANYLSQKEEEMSTRGMTAGNRDALLGKMAAEQQVLREAVAGLQQRADELGQQSPFLSADLMSYIREAMRQLDGACNNLGQQRGRAAEQQQREAVYNLNRASIRMLEALNEQKQCNKGGSCNKSSQKLQALCEKQNDINQQTTGSCPKPGQSLSPGQREALQRLAAEQGSVRKSMEELQQEFGDRRELLGRLDALSAEARKIEEMLTDGQVGQELQDKQLKIYSRLLDLQKSLSRRDYTEERKAVTGEDIVTNSPGALEEGSGQLEQSLQDRLQKSLQDGYPRQYEQQIKAYFKALSNFVQPVDSTK